MGPGLGTKRCDMSSIGNLAGGTPDLATYLQHHKHGAADQLFAKIDTDGDGKISKQELEAAFKAHGGTAEQADAMFAKLDTDGDGSVSKAEFVAGMRGRHHAQGADAASNDNAANSLTAQSTNAVTNADGSTTTTITTADGTKITITTPPQTDDKTSTDPTAPKLSFLA